MQAEKRPLKLLLGGVPVGCDNVGDEAILACVVELLRGMFPEAELTVCTRKQEETARSLGVRAVPLYGFGKRPEWRGFAQEVKLHDAFIWFGATGLSDYPETALELLRIARKARVKTIVWGVGMDSELNPAFYRAAGKRLALLRFLTACCFQFIDWVGIYENWLARRVKAKIRRELSRCALVVVRDEESAEELRRCGFSKAVVGADTAILLEAAETPPFLREQSEAVWIGFCISAQRAVREMGGVFALWNRILEKVPHSRILLIPMNPLTDRPLMRELATQSKWPERIDCVEETEPQEVQARVAQCRAVVSSRLHLLILAANAGVPFIGIVRGSKISNWLRHFGQAEAGTVAECDFGAIEAALDEILAKSPRTARATLAGPMRALRERLQLATGQLRRVLEED